MRLISFGSPGSERPGIVDDDDRVVPLDPLLQRLNLGYADVSVVLALRTALAELIEEELDSTAERIPMHSVRLGPPVPRPRSIFGIGRNYGEAPGRPSGKAISYFDAPPIFMKPTSALVGPHDLVRLPETSNAVDYEIELAIVIGCRGRDISADDADRYVAGYLVANDITAYDLVFGTADVDRMFSQPAIRSQLLVGKGYDSFLPCGPWLLTADAVDVDSIELMLSVNDELRQAGKVAEMLLDVPTIVELISRFTTLHPGDLILTGTPPGGGVGMNPPRFLSDGDEIVASAGPLGALRNRVRAA